jgi:hypothetical protein
MDDTTAARVQTPHITLAEAGHILGLGDNPPPTIDVIEAGRIIGASRNAAYAAASRGEIPTIRIGRLLRVPVVALAGLLIRYRTGPT